MRNTRSFCTLFVFLLFPFSILRAQPAKQNHIDSLIVSIPSLMRGNEERARVLIGELERRSQAARFPHGLVQTAFFKAWLSYRHLTADQTIKTIDSALKHISGIEKDTALVKFYILKGQCFVKKTDYSQALTNFKKALQLAEARKDVATELGALISIGWAYMEDGKPAEAIPIFFEVLRRNPSPSYENRDLLFCNIASCYNTTGQFHLSERYAKEGIALARKNHNNSSLANGLNILGRSYYQQGKMAQAISLLQEAATVRQKVADPSMLASDYLELADLYLKNHQAPQAIDWAKKSEAISRSTGNKLKLAEALSILAEAYEANQDYKNANHYLKQVVQQNDSTKEAENSRAFAAMQVQFETQKRKAENLELKKENLESRLQNSRQQRLLVVLAAGFLLLSASVFYFVKLMKSRYKTRLALAALQEQKQRTLAVIEAEEKERRRIAADLHDGIGQTLVAAGFQLTKVRQGKSPVEKLDGLIQQASQEVRQLAHQVTPDLLLRHGLEQTLAESIRQLNEANDQTVFHLYTHMEQAPADDSLSLSLYRCFQEISSNILKHASARNVHVQLQALPDEIQLIVEDDGVGFSDTEQKGIGLKNIQNRLSVYNGVLHVDSTPGKGSSFLVQVPVPPQTN